MLARTAKLIQIDGRVNAAAVAGGRTFVAIDGGVAAVGEGGELGEQFELKLGQLKGLAPFKPGFLLAANRRAVHQVDLKLKTTQVVVDLDKILIGLVPNDRLIRFGELAGVAFDGGKFLFVAIEAGYSSSVFKIDVNSRKIVQQAFTPGPTPSSLQFEGGNLFLVDRSTELLRRFDPSLKLSLKSIPVGVPGARAVLVQGDEIRALAPGQVPVVRKAAPVTAQLRAPIELKILSPRIEAIKDLIAINLKKKYAVLVTGDVAESGYECFWNDTVWMYKMLRGKGYSAQDIIVLYGNGADYPSPNPFYNPAETVTDFAATPANLNMVLDGLKSGNAAKGIPKMDSNDSLFLWTFDHGSQTGSGEALLCLWGGSLSASHIAGKANAIAYEKRAIFMQQCFSGGFIPWLKNNKTFIATACSADELAHRADTELETVSGHQYRHGEFNYYVISAFDKKIPTGAAVNADTLAADGKVSSKEANNWWVTHENRPETPQSNDMGGVGAGFFLN